MKPDSLLERSKDNARRKFKRFILTSACSANLQESQPKLQIQTTCHKTVNGKNVCMFLIEGKSESLRNKFLQVMI